MGRLKIICIEFAIGPSLKIAAASAGVLGRR
jgi:hypothetical protein